LCSLPALSYELKTIHISKEQTSLDYANCLAKHFPQKNWLFVENCMILI